MERRKERDRAQRRLPLRRDRQPNRFFLSLSAVIFGSCVHNMRKGWVKGRKPLLPLGFNPK